MKLNVEGLREQIENESRLKFEEREDYKATNEKVAEMIGAKLRNNAAYRGTNKPEIKGIAAKYMGMPITDILQEQRKAENVLEDAEKRLESFLDAHYKKAMKLHIGVPESTQSELANEYVERYIVGSYAREDEDREAVEAHKLYTALYSEVARCRTEKNAVLLAKDAFIDDNRELIAEEQKQARLRDIRKSGLLKELGIAEEKAEEVTD